MLSCPDRNILLGLAWRGEGKLLKFSFRMNGDLAEILTEYHQITCTDLYNKVTEIKTTDKAESKEIIKHCGLHIYYIIFLEKNAGVTI
jgi:hypothetical protein